MKALLIKPDKIVQPIYINSLDEIRQIVCDFEQDGIMELIYFSDLKSVLIHDAMHASKKYRLNKNLKRMACKNGWTTISNKAIYGFVLFIEDVDRFNELPLEVDI